MMSHDVIIFKNDFKFKKKILTPVDMWHVILKNNLKNVLKIHYKSNMLSFWRDFYVVGFFKKERLCL
jgi:hypothetical protein